MFGQLSAPLTMRQDSNATTLDENPLPSLPLLALLWPSLADLSNVTLRGQMTEDEDSLMRVQALLSEQNEDLREYQPSMAAITLWEDAVFVR